MCIITESEADVAAFKDFKDDAPAAAKAAAPAPAPAPAAPAPAPPPPAPPAAAAAPPPPKPATAGERVFASPFAKRIAAEKGLDLAVSENYSFMEICNILN